MNASIRSAIRNTSCDATITNLRSADVDSFVRILVPIFRRSSTSHSVNASGRAYIVPATPMKPPTINPMPSHSHVMGTKISRNLAKFNRWA